MNGGPRADHVSEISIDSNDSKVTGGIVPMHYFGYFILLTGLQAQLEPGTPIDLELEFEKAGKIEVPTRVRENRPGLTGVDREVAAVRTSRAISLPPINARISMVSGDLVGGNIGNPDRGSRFILKFGDSAPSADAIFWSTTKAAFYKPSDIAKGTVDGIQYAYYFGNDAHSNQRYRLVHSVIDRACRVHLGRSCDWIGGQ